MYIAVVAYNAQAIVSYNRMMAAKGKVKGIFVEIYSEPECINTITEIDWGWVEPNMSYSKIIWIKQLGNYPWVNLSMWTENWIPVNASDFLVLTWDREGYEMHKFDPPVNATLTLWIDANVTDIQDFSFDIIIKGEG